MDLNETHDPSLLSWVESANEAGSDFPIQNLPFGVFRRQGTTEPFRGGIAIGDRVIDLELLVDARVLGTGVTKLAATAAKPALNDFMALGMAAWSGLRLEISRALRQGSPARGALESCLIPQCALEYAVPAQIGDYTDFYTSIHHATAVGRLFRPDTPLLPNYKWVPIAYHGRCSSIGISGTDFYRPVGQVLLSGADSPVLRPSARLDYELELGVFVGPGNALGSQIDIDAAESHIFGLCLLNDWSARDVQAWEYQPLGPFLGKNFATSLSAWVVTLEALEPFRVSSTRPAGDPSSLPYLSSARQTKTGSVDITLEAHLQTQSMRGAGVAIQRLSRSSFKHAYWTLAQMVTHHAVNGCNLQPGDLLGTGTQSGPTPQEAGSMLELTSNGTRPILLPNGDHRPFLEDGDTVTLRGFCERPGARRIGFGEVSGCVLPARNAHADRPSSGVSVHAQQQEHPSSPGFATR
jgi:fumarylacetoacetase